MAAMMHVHTLVVTVAVLFVPLVFVVPAYVGKLISILNVTLITVILCMLKKDALLMRKII